MGDGLAVPDFPADPAPLAPEGVHYRIPVMDSEVLSRFDISVEQVPEIEDPGVPHLFHIGFQFFQQFGKKIETPEHRFRAYPDRIRTDHDLLYRTGKVRDSSRADDESLLA